MGTETKYRLVGHSLGRCVADLGDSPRNKFGGTLDLDHDLGDARFIAFEEDVLSAVINRGLLQLNVNTDLMYSLLHRGVAELRILKLRDPVFEVSDIDLRDVFSQLGWSTYPWVYVGSGVSGFAILDENFEQVIDNNGSPIVVANLLNADGSLVSSSDNIICEHQIHNNGIGRFYVRKVEAGNPFSSDNVQPGAWAEIVDINPQEYSYLQGYYPILGVEGDYLYLGSKVDGSLPHDFDRDDIGNIRFRPFSEVISYLEGLSPLARGYPVENPPDTGANPRGTVRVYGGMFYPSGRQSTTSKNLVLHLSNSIGTGQPARYILLATLRMAGDIYGIEQQTHAIWDAFMRRRDRLTLDGVYRGLSYDNPGVRPAQGKTVIVDYGSVDFVGDTVPFNDLPSLVRLEITNEANGGGHTEVTIDNKTIDLQGGRLYLRSIGWSPGIANPGNAGSTVLSLNSSGLYQKMHSRRYYGNALSSWSPATVLKIVVDSTGKEYWAIVDSAPGEPVLTIALFYGSPSFAPDTPVTVTAYEPVVYEGPGMGWNVAAINEPRDTNYLNTANTYGSGATLFGIYGYYRSSNATYSNTPLFRVMAGPAFGTGTTQMPFSGIKMTPTVFEAIQDPSIDPTGQARFTFINDPSFDFGRIRTDAGVFQVRTKELNLAATQEVDATVGSDYDLTPSAVYGLIAGSRARVREGADVAIVADGSTENTSPKIALSASANTVAGDAVVYIRARNDTEFGKVGIDGVPCIRYEEVQASQSGQVFTATLNYPSGTIVFDGDVTAGQQIIVEVNNNLCVPYETSVFVSVYELFGQSLLVGSVFVSSGQFSVRLINWDQNSTNVSARLSFHLIRKLT